MHTDDCHGRAHECRKGCKCLSEGGSPDCAVTQIVDNKVFFVDAPRSTVCCYRCSFGNASLCLCPVRQHQGKKA